MARPRKIIPDKPKEAVFTTKDYQGTTAVMDPEEDIKEIDKEIAIFTDPSKQKYEKITFINNRDPNRALEFFYVSKTHPYKRYHLHHGKEYNLPVEIIEHLEGSNPMDPNTCQSFGYEDRFDARSGFTKSQITSYKPLYQCKTVRSR